jgi:hypothetical protein
LGRSLEDIETGFRENAIVGPDGEGVESPAGERSD